MIESEFAHEAERLAVRIGEVKVAPAGSLLFAIGIGSCVALAMHDPRSRIAGLAHVMLPEPVGPRPIGPTGRFAGEAVDALLRMMTERGAWRSAIGAKLAGGAAMFASVLPESGRKLGERNVSAVRAALAVAGIPILGEDVLGSHGRSVFLHPADGRFLITSVKHGDVIL